MSSPRPGDADRLDDELIRLEEIVSHQQRVVQQLSEALAATRNELDASRRRIDGIEAAVRRLLDASPPGESAEDERPPHY